MSLAQLNSNLVKATEFGATWTKVSNPYTPTKDGFLRAVFSPAASTTAAVHVREAGVEYYQAVSVSGVSVFGFLPAKKGKSYTLNASQNGTLELYFMPLNKL